MGNFGIQGQMQQQLLALEGISGISASELNSIMREGGISAVNNRMILEQNNRDKYRNAIFGGDISALDGILNDEQMTSMSRAAYGFYRDQNPNMKGAGGRRDFDTLEGIERRLGDQSDEFMIEYLTQSGEHDAAANVILRSIANNTAVPPQIIIDGKVDEGDGVATLQINIQTLINEALEE